jgi:hypothetical protein
MRVPPIQFQGHYSVNTDGIKSSRQNLIHDIQSKINPPSKTRGNFTWPRLVILEHEGGYEILCEDADNEITNQAVAQTIDQFNAAFTEHPESGPINTNTLIFMYGILQQVSDDVIKAHASPEALQAEVTRLLQVVREGFATGGIELLV